MVAILNVFLVAKMVKVMHGLEERVKCFSATFETVAFLIFFQDLV